jgi:hypothetical protein
MRRNAPVEALRPTDGQPIADPQPFTRTWIFGVYDGAVTFYEAMVTRAFLMSTPSTCFPIKSPPAVARSGFYPTQSCLRHEARTGEYAVSMETFVFREAQRPVTP